MVFAAPANIETQREERCSAFWDDNEITLGWEMKKGSTGLTIREGHRQEQVDQRARRVSKQVPRGAAWAPAG